jgi:hypothetical protein
MARDESDRHIFRLFRRFCVFAVRFLRFAGLDMAGRTLTATDAHGNHNRPGAAAHAFDQRVADTSCAGDAMAMAAGAVAP